MPLDMLIRKVQSYINSSNKIFGQSSTHAYLQDQSLSSPLPNWPCPPSASKQT